MRDAAYLGVLGVRPILTVLGRSVGRCDEELARG
jgi:hypothetical protein